MIAYLFSFHVVHWSFTLVQGWLLSNNFCKACQNCLHLSVCHIFFYTKQCECINCCFVVKVPANAIMQHNVANLDKTNFDMFLQNWLLCSHPWPNMNEQCTKLKKKNYAIKPRFSFIQLNQATYSKLGGKKSYFDMFYQNNCWEVICYPICMTNVSYERKIIVL